MELETNSDHTSEAVFVLDERQCGSRAATNNQMGVCCVPILTVLTAIDRSQKVSRRESKAYILKST